MGEVCTCRIDGKVKRGVASGVRKLRLWLTSTLPPSTAVRCADIAATSPACFAGEEELKAAHSYRNGGSSKLRSLRECRRGPSWRSRSMVAMPMRRCWLIARS